jgi:putative heme utilization radical SAM enzyme HutW
MNWTQEAQQTLESAPPFVRATIRQCVQEYARRQGIDTITADLLLRAREEFMPKKKNDGSGIERFFAREGVDPLEGAFEDDIGPHPGMRETVLPSSDAADTWNKAASAIDQSPRRALYIHVPFCRSRCTFCPFYTYKSGGQELASYTDALIREMAMVSVLPVSAGHPIHSVYFGGGTPTELAAPDLYRLLSTVRDRFPLANDCEITVECRVSGFTTEKMRACIDGGANRFSVGIQSFDTHIRRGVGRIADTNEILSALDHLCSFDSAAIVIDLIYGLPRQTMKTWESDIDTFINRTGVHGIDMYKLKMVPGSVLSGSGRSADLPDVKQMGHMFKLGCEIMKEHGFTCLSNCHWARGTRERNRYNTDTAFGGTCIPIGSSAGGKVADCRFFQESDLKRYYDSVNAGLKPVASAMMQPEHSDYCEEIAGQVALGAIDFGAISSHAHNATHGLNRLIGQWEECGLLYFVSGDRIELTTAGRFWSNKIVQGLIEYRNHTI